MKKNQGLQFYKPEKKVRTGILGDLFACLIVMAIAILIGVVGVYFYGRTTQTVGSSMEPTLYNGQRVLIDSFSYVLGAPKRGDVVVFLPHGNEKTHYYIKRVVALPGETVQIGEDGRLYVNQEPSEVVTGVIQNPGSLTNPLVIPKGQYFCMGDNPDEGEDSRHPNIGPVRKEDIAGKAWLHLSFRTEGVAVKIGLIP